MEDKTKRRTEHHFVKQLFEYYDELNDELKHLVISQEAQHILHKIYTHMNHYSFNQMVKERKEDSAVSVKESLLTENTKKEK